MPQSKKAKRLAALDRRRTQLEVLKAGGNFAGRVVEPWEQARKIAAAEADVRNLEKKLAPPMPQEVLS